MHVGRVLWYGLAIIHLRNVGSSGLQTDKEGFVQQHVWRRAILWFLLL